MTKGQPATIRKSDSSRRHGWLLLVAIFAGVGILALLRPPPFTHDPPRQLPWKLPDHTRADTQWRYLDDGRIRIEIQHLPLPGVTPGMLAWFYRQLPISKAELNGRRYTLYHIFHPSEHGYITVREPAADNLPGMGEGAVVERGEWFGPYDSVGKALITHFSDKGFTAVPTTLGLEMGRMEHHFEPGENGARYRVVAEMGSTHPLVAPWLNFYLRQRVFTPEMVRQWIRHQVEEVGSLPSFLPAIYQQRNADNLYQIPPATP